MSRTLVTDGHLCSRQVWLLRGAGEGCLVQLALRMEPFVFAPGELPSRRTPSPALGRCSPSLGPTQVWHKLDES